jgi:hypothetical protein|tara:strand:+ start:78 stop:491 length:414 start_codon:yes stop_codon:yes gene_type:complete
MTTITAKKGELVNLINALFAVQELKGKKFGLAVSKNLIILKKELKELEDVGKPSEEFMKLAEEVNVIANSESEDSKEQIDNLEKENEDLVAKRREQLDIVTHMMTEEMSVELNTLSEDILPEEISAIQINSLIKIIE